MIGPVLMGIAKTVGTVGKAIYFGAKIAVGAAKFAVKTVKGIYRVGKASVRALKSVRNNIRSIVHTAHSTMFSSAPPVTLGRNGALPPVLKKAPVTPSFASKLNVNRSLDAKKILENHKPEESHLFTSKEG